MSGRLPVPPPGQALGGPEPREVARADLGCAEFFLDEHLGVWVIE
ncbi:hypothetical protein [Streptomyces sp. MA5143a]|nr:hypothetical protein [Streptomyces sp. MA5143a]SPE99879.1 hypothetical protein SMA5143A_0588 [Streptomyces sp. MA5143a]